MFVWKGYSDIFNYRKLYFEGLFLFIHINICNTNTFFCMCEWTLHIYTFLSIVLWHDAHGGPPPLLLLHSYIDYHAGSLSRCLHAVALCLRWQHSVLVCDYSYEINDDESTVNWRFFFPTTIATIIIVVAVVVIYYIDTKTSRSISLNIFPYSLNSAESTKCNIKIVIQ